jgi:hypothetical protein
MLSPPILAIFLSPPFFFHFVLKHYTRRGKRLSGKEDLAVQGGESLVGEKDGGERYGGESPPRRAQKARVLEHTRSERLATDKHISLLGTIASYEENEVLLCIPSQVSNLKICFFLS